jgi:two-component system, NarL family, nitrate/nitrite response regulator NarL
MQIQHLEGPSIRSLSERELEVLERALLGETNREIAGALSVTVHAIKFHLGSIYRKLGVVNRTEAAVILLRSRDVLKDTPPTWN